MAAKKPHKLSSGEKKERRQQKLLNDYSKQQKWLIGAGILILILILLLAAAIGYSYNWGQGVNKDSTRQFTPASSTTGPTSEAAPQGSGGGTGSSGGTGGTGGSGSGGGTNNSTGTTNTGSSSTTKETTTTNNNTTTNNPTTTTPVPGLLQTLLSEIQTGDSIDDIINRAQDLGVPVNCSVELLIVRVCDFSQDGETITVRSLLSNGLVNSILTSF